MYGCGKWGELMEIPSQVKIGPFVYQVKQVELVSKDRPELIGEVKHDVQQVILIDNSLNPDKKQSVFLHELIHCVDVLMRIGLEEKQVEQLENGLYMVLKDNDLLKD